MTTYNGEDMVGDDTPIEELPEMVRKRLAELASLRSQLAAADALAAAAAKHNDIVTKEVIVGETCEANMNCHADWSEVTDLNTTLAAYRAARAQGGGA